jgi:hypothetical protein
MAFKRSKLSVRVVVPAVVAGALAVGAAAIAWADSSPSPSPSSSAGKQGDRPDRVGGLERHALHGEFVVPQRGQRLRDFGAGTNIATMVVDTQRGEITAIDKGKKTVTLQSPDGFTRTYVVTSDTRIRSRGQDESFADLQTGERAMVMAEKQGDSYVAHVIRCVHESRNGNDNSNTSNS